MNRRFTLAHHGHCFDGMASAALLSRFLRETGGETDFTFRGLDHQPGGSFVPEEVLSGDENAVVDFRYTTSPKLTWFFDHHETGVKDGEERAHLAAHQDGKRFFDPKYGSCCKLIADVAREKLGWEAPDLAELVAWADVIDAARFPSAEMPVRLVEPALRLMTVVEVHGSDKFLAPRIDALSRGATLEQIVAEPDVQAKLGPLLEVHDKTLLLIRARATHVDGVVFFDLVGENGDRYNKFIPYWLFPESRYCVAVTAGKARSKVSVGSNPWAPRPRTHDIAAICAKYGGGGHPVVGAVSLPPGDIEKARAIAKEIVATLSEG